MMQKKLRAISGGSRPERAPAGADRRDQRADHLLTCSPRPRSTRCSGSSSFGVLMALQVEFVVFLGRWSSRWRTTCPTSGSLAAVALVVLQVLAQTGSIETTLVALAFLVAAQVYVGNWLEPRWLSRSSNLGPFTVLLSLVVWAALWGMPGAILAVPLTSILMIVLASAPQTRPIAILMSRTGASPEAGFVSRAPRARRRRAGSGWGRRPGRRCGSR